MVVRTELAAPSVGWRWWLGASAVLVAAVLIGAVIGPASIGFLDAAKALVSLIPGIDITSNLSELELGILEVVRFPRVFLAVLVGAALSVSGAAYQGVFRNPLADPYLLGVAAGAGLGATLAIVTVGSGGGGTLPIIPAAAFVGAIVGVLLSYGLGRTVGGARTVTSLILAGVAVAAFLTAIQTFVQQRNAETLREVYDWILGRLATTGWDDFRLILPYMVISGLGIFVHRRALDVMAVGDEEASSLGLEVGRTEFHAPSSGRRWGRIGGRVGRGGSGRRRLRIAARRGNDKDQRNDRRETNHPPSMAYRPDRCYRCSSAHRSSIA